MPKTFFIADTHFYHRNVILYEQIRAEAIAEYCIKNIDEYKNCSLKEMQVFINTILKENINKTLVDTFIDIHNEILISRWNEVVNKNDTVWMLGDFALANKEKIKAIVSRLNGNINLVMGNHDNYSKKFYEEAGFNDVYSPKQEVVIKHYFILSHFPVAYINEFYPFYSIYGHVHGDPRFLTETAQTRCVSAERTNLYPIELEVFNNYKEETDEKNN